MAALNLDTHTWEPVVSADGPLAPAPGPRASGTFTTLEDDKIVLFGGYNGEIFLNDLWILQIHPPSVGNGGLPTYRWENVPASREPRASLGTAMGSGARCGLPPCDWPCPRSGHVGAAIGSLIIMVAGRHRAGRNNDVFVLDAASGWAWHAPPAIGEPFKPRKTHAVGLVGARLFLFGGHSGSDWCADLNVLDLSALVRGFVSRPTIAQPRSSLIADFTRMVALPPVRVSAAVPRREPVGARGADALVVLAKALDAARGGAPGSRMGAISDVRGGDNEDFLSPSSHAAVTATEEATADEGVPFSLSSYERFFRARFGPTDTTSFATTAGLGSESVGFLAPRSLSTPDVSFSAYSTGRGDTSRSSTSRRAPAGDVGDDEEEEYAEAEVEVEVEEAGRGGGGSGGDNNYGAFVAVNAPPSALTTEAGAISSLTPPRALPQRCRSVNFAKLLDASEISNTSRVSDEAGGGGAAEGYMGGEGPGLGACPLPAAAAARATTTVLGDMDTDDDESSSLALAPYYAGAPAGTGAGSQAIAIPILGLGGGLFTDVIFLVEGVRVPLHRCVLAARSEYFHSMLMSSQWSETRGLAAGVLLPDISLPVFGALVRFLYTDELPSRVELDTLVVPLLAQAQKMGLRTLSLHCQRHLEEALDVDNVSAVLDVADSLGVRPLRRAAMCYILDRYEAVSLSPAFVGLRETLLREVLARRAARATPPPAASSAQRQQRSPSPPRPVTVAAPLPLALPALPSEPASMTTPAPHIRPLHYLTEENAGVGVPVVSHLSAGPPEAVALARPALTSLLFSPWASAAAALTIELNTLRLQSPLAGAGAGAVATLAEADVISAAHASSAALTAPAQSTQSILLSDETATPNLQSPTSLGSGIGTTTSPPLSADNAAGTDSATEVEGAPKRRRALGSRITPQSVGDAHVRASSTAAAAAGGGGGGVDGCDISGGSRAAAALSEAQDGVADIEVSESVEGAGAAALQSSGAKRRRSLPPR